MQSVNIARKRADRRTGTLSIRKRKAKGALNKDSVLDKVNILPALIDCTLVFAYRSIFYSLIPKSPNYSYRENNKDEDVPCFNVSPDRFKVVSYMENECKKGCHP